MDDWVDRVLTVLIWLLVILTVVTTIYFVASTVRTTQGTVVDKDYSSQTLICSKTCMVVPECWTIMVDDIWWDNSVCVSERHWRTITIGDYFKE